MSQVSEKIRVQLRSLADEKYRQFMLRLIPGEERIIGVRAPQLRSLAKQLAKDDWRSYFEENPHTYYEETLLQGLTIGYLKEEPEEIFRQMELFLPRISNWAVCDSFCAGLKNIIRDREAAWDYICQKLNSQQSFTQRFAVVMLLDYFIDREHISRLLALLDAVSSDDYYVKMAVAWAISSCFAAFPSETLEYLKSSTLDDFTYNKALQKICESLKTDGDTKLLIKTMKRKVK